MQFAIGEAAIPRGDSQRCRATLAAIHDKIVNASVEWRGRGVIPFLQQCQVLRADDRDLSNPLMVISMGDNVENMLELLQKASTFNIIHNTGVELSSQLERIVLMDTGSYRERVRETGGRRRGVRWGRMGRFLHTESHTTTVREF